HHRSGAPLDRAAARPAQARPLLRVREVRLRRRHPHRCRRLRPAVHPAGRDAPEHPDHRAGLRRAAEEPRPDDGRGQADRLAGPAGRGRRRPEHQPRPHQRDHGHLDGGAHPPLQAGDRGLPGPAGPGLRRHRVPEGGARLPRRLRRWHPALPGPLPRPLLQQPAGHRGHVRRGQPRRRRRRGRLDRPGHWRSGSLMTIKFGRQDSFGHLKLSAESKEPYSEETLEALTADAAQILERYPQKRSALLPLLHLVQSVDGYVTGRGINFCADLLELTRAEVSGVATFYTQYKRHPSGEYNVGVCTNTLCAIMGGDQIFDELSEHLDVGHDETTEDGKVTLEHLECNAACDYAPVLMVNWEFFDNQTPESATKLVDDLRAGNPVRPTRGPDRVCSFKEVS